MTTPSPSDSAREAQRQQWLLAQLLGRDAAAPGDRSAWLRETEPRAERALQAYRANAGALAERALAAAYPTVAELLGDEAFGQLARALWHAAPAQCGDMGLFGADLAPFVEASDQLRDEPYLPDLARLEWAVHRAAFAADAGNEAPPLQRLAQADAAELRLVLRPGSAIVCSAHPVHAIWQAHRLPRGAERDEAFALVRQRRAAGEGDNAFVMRNGWRVDVVLLTDTDARFTAALLGGATLSAALDAGGDPFDFEAWLRRALTGSWLADIAASRNPNF
jgi:Putative DNA-binding domain